jgi:hypothetical protein
MKAVITSAALACLILAGCGGSEGGGDAAGGENSAAAAPAKEDKLAQSPTEEGAEEPFAIGLVQRSGSEWIVIEQEPGGAKRRQLTTTPVQAGEQVEYVDLSRYDGRRVRFAYQTKDDDTYWGVEADSLTPFETARGRVDVRDPQNVAFIENEDTRRRRLTEAMEPVGEQVGQEPEAVPLTGITRALTFEYLRKDNGWYYGVDRSSMKQAQQ